MNKIRNEIMSLTDGFDSDSLRNLPAVARRGIKNEGALVVKNTVVANLHEQGRAMLTNTVLENVGILSSMEEHLSEIAPNGAGRYKAIVDAYTLGAAQLISRW